MIIGGLANCRSRDRVCEGASAREGGQGRRSEPATPPCLAALSPHGVVRSPVGGAGGDWREAPARGRHRGEPVATPLTAEEGLRGGPGWAAGPTLEYIPGGGHGNLDFLWTRKLPATSPPKIEDFGPDLFEKFCKTSLKVQGPPGRIL